MDTTVTVACLLTSIILLLFNSIIVKQHTIPITIQQPPRRRVRLVTQRKPQESIENLIERHRNNARRLGLDKAPWKNGEIRLRFQERF